MKKDIFLSTKKNIIAISTITVFVCLIIFAIITQALYSSRVLDNVDHQLLEQKSFLTEQPFDLEHEQNFDADNFTPHENHPKGKATIQSSKKIEAQPEEFEGLQNGKPMHIPPNLIVIIYNNSNFEVMSKNLYFSEDNLPVFQANSENEIVTLSDEGYNFRGTVINYG